MAWTNPTTRVADELIDQADWNTDVTDNLTHLHGGLPSARVYHNTTQSMTLATDNIVLFNSERWDTDTLHSTVSNTGRLTCFTAGKYQLTAHIEWSTVPATCELEFRLNGTTKIAWQSFTGSAKRCSLTTLYDLAAGDYVELIVNPVSTQTILSTANYSPEFMAHRVG